MAGEADTHEMVSDGLFEAIHNNNIDHVMLYIEQGVDVKKQYYSQLFKCHMSPLALACCLGHEEIMEVLLSIGADPNQASGKNEYPAMIMAAQESVITLSMMAALISHGADVNSIGTAGRTILHYLACGQFNDTGDNAVTAARLLLDKGASFYAQDQFDRTPLFESCRWGRLDILKLFIDRRADVNYNTGHRTMLKGAVKNCDIDMFDVLLNAGVNRDLTSDDLIHPCVMNNHAMIEKILDTCDVDINLPIHVWNVGMTILHYACEASDVTSETVRLLLDRGANVRAVCDVGDTVLHYAVMHCDCSKIRQILLYNPPINIKNSQNQTPLISLIHNFLIYLDQYLPKFLSARLPAFKMLVMAGAKVTADVDNKLNQFRIKHPEAQISNHKINATRNLKEMSRLVIREMIHVPVDASLHRLPIPILLQEYLNFPEFDVLVDEYLKICCRN